jgi:hypothetical protein
MHNDGYGDLFFASQFVNGLKEEMKYTVQSQVPEDVDRAMLSGVEGLMRREAR